jgi:hypothetical protein
VKYTSLGCSQANDTTQPRSALGQYPVHRHEYAREHFSAAGLYDNIHQQTLMASSAKDLQDTHHCGLNTGSIKSPDFL